MPSEKLRLLYKDLASEYPRSPRDTMGGFVIAARTLDKCRASLNGTAGEYHFNCPLDNRFLSFAGITAEEFKNFVATGATDTEMDAWIREKAKRLPRLEVIKWNNQIRYCRISELPDDLQEYLEDYIPQFIRKNRPVYHWFDVYDLEEERI